MSSAPTLRRSIAAMLAAEGRAVTMTYKAAGTYDAATGAGTPGATSTKSGRARIGSYDDRLVDGTRIRQGDRLVLFQPDDWTYVPAEGHVLDAPATASMPATKLVAVSIKTRELGGVPISYTMQMRGT